MPLTPHTPKPSGRAHLAGWTLTEMLVALLLVVTLTSIALPSFQSQQRQARRSDAQSALQQLQLNQAMWRGQHASHASDLGSLGWSTELSQGGHYRIAIEEARQDGYTLSATPIGSQARDTACAPMRLQWRHSASVVLSSGASQDSDIGRCWRQ